MNTTKAIFGLLLLLLIKPGSEAAIRCMVCNTEELEPIASQCKDPNPTRKPVENKNPDPLCRKIVTEESDGHIRIDRMAIAGDEFKGIRDACVSYFNLREKVTDCICSSDNCNSAGFVASSIVATLATFLLATIVN